MDSAVGVPPESVQDKTADCPAVIADGVAIKLSITGAKIFTSMVNSFEAVVEFASVALMVNVAVAPVVGMPDKVSPDKIIPAGSAPDSTAQT